MAGGGHWPSDGEGSHGPRGDPLGGTGWRRGSALGLEEVLPWPGVGVGGKALSRAWKDSVGSEENRKVKSGRSFKVAAWLTGSE